MKPRFGRHGTFRVRVRYSAVVQGTDGGEERIDLFSNIATVEFREPTDEERIYLDAIWANSSFFAPGSCSVFGVRPVSDSFALRVALDEAPENRIKDHTRLMLAAHLAGSGEEPDCAAAKKLLSKLRNERPRFRTMEVAYWMARAYWQRGRGDIDQACQILSQLVEAEPELRTDNMFMRIRLRICFDLATFQSYEAALKSGDPWTEPRQKNTTN